MKRVVFITGKYGGFRAMLPLIRLFEDHPGWEAQVEFLDQHLEEAWGETWEECHALIKYGHWNAKQFQTRIPNLFAQFAAIGARWETARPDLVIVYGDRADTLLGATLAQQLNIPVAHLQAGDKTGCIDDVTRWAVSALADHAFCSSQMSADRFIEQGSSHTKVHVVGDHHLDAVANAMLRDPWNGTNIIAHWHPDTRLSRGENYAQTKDFWECVEKLASAVTADVEVLPPCNDLHHDICLDLMPKPGTRWATIHRTIPFDTYIPMLQCARLLVGNTSATKIDAPFLSTRSLSVGTRQEGREGGGHQILTWGKPRELFHAMLAAYEGRRPRPYRGLGDGTASQLTFEVLNEAYNHS